MAKSNKTSDEITFLRNMVLIPHLDFFGAFSKSPNGLFTLSWGSKDRASYVLIKKEKVLVQGKLSLRAMDGRVADNGNFIIIDILGDKLDCIFYAFDMMGQQLIQQKFNANSLRAALSKDGKFAACHLANNPKHQDGGTVAIFDLAYNNLIWQKKPHPGWDKDYEFLW